jgi:hypothetical protein
MADPHAKMKIVGEYITRMNSRVQIRMQQAALA